jgi:hypothetical protein
MNGVRLDRNEHRNLLNQDFGHLENNQRLSLSPVSPPGAAQAMPSVMSSGQPEPGDQMHIGILARSTGTQH